MSAWAGADADATSANAAKTRWTFRIVTLRRTDQVELGRSSGATRTAQVYPREVEAVRRGLQARGFALALEVAQVIADAFLADAVARAPAPRLRVWARS